MLMLINEAAIRVNDLAVLVATKALSGSPKLNGIIVCMVQFKWVTKRS